MKKYKKKIFIILFVIFTAISIVWSVTDTEEEPKEIVKETIKPKKKEEKVQKQKVIIDVKGAVNSPGVYELTADNNVIDAINAAGGLTNGSDTSNINLSKKLRDEMVIIVYTAYEIQNMKETQKVVCPKVNDACTTKEDEDALLEEQKTSNVNINTATKEELMTLTGVGEAKALAIIEYREKNGNFESTEDIKKVAGIGDSLFEKIKDNISV